MICHQIRFRGDDSFSYWLKKKNQKNKKKQDIFCSRMWAWIIRVKRCTVGMHNAMAKIGLETNSSADVSLEMEKAPLLHCWLK